MTPRYAAVISRSAISLAQGGPSVDLPGAAPQPWMGQAMCWWAGCTGVAATVGGPLLDRLWDRQHGVLRRHRLRVGARTDWRSGGHQRRHRRPRSPPPVAAAQSTRMPPIPGPPPGSPSAAKPGASCSRLQSSAATRSRSRSAKPQKFSGARSLRAPRCGRRPRVGTLLAETGSRSAWTSFSLPTARPVPPRPVGV